MTYQAVDCQSFAGGFTLGTVRAGFELVAKKEMKGGFGVANCEANRALLGSSWQAQVSDPVDWEPRAVPYVFGNPPCSGFSLMSDKKFRGIDSPANACMHALVNYAAKCDPEIVVFESVQQAYSTGHSLMQKLRLELEEKTGHSYDLIHVLHNAASVGGAAIRRRYFWVASRIPFGVETPVVTRVPLLNDVIGDLEPLSLTWERQPYRAPASWWVEHHGALSPSGAVDGHKNKPNPYTNRALDLIAGAGPWAPRENVETMLKRHWALHESLPESWEPERVAKLLANDFDCGFNQLTRWHGGRMARVVTGGGGTAMVHPNLDRVLTHREVARIMGFPDDWLIKPLRGQTNLVMTWGKGITVQCGEWISGWVKRALDGDPGAERGEEIGDREWTHNSTLAYKTASAER